MLNLWRNFSTEKDTAPYDRQVLFLTITLVLIGLVMIFSASITQAANKYDNMFFFVIRDVVAIAVACGFGVAAMMMSGDFLRQNSFYMLLAGFLLLALVLAVGTEINHAKRWIRFGSFNIQPAEYVKLIWILYLASFMTRKREEVTRKMRAFIKQLLLLVVLGAFLLMQPDYGSLAVIVGVFIGVLFVGGAHFYSFAVCMALVLLLMVGAAVLEPYRLVRITTFLDPWQDPFNKGYQLTQSLMAFGRGGFIGDGLGNSVLKMEYLPEAHTDFVFAILGEETGFVGVSFVILLQIWLISRIFYISRKMLKAGELFGGFVCFGVSMLLAIQSVINVGAASGMLPTKGLTFPLISYGGSSLAVVVSAIAIVLKLDYEFKMKFKQAESGKSGKTAAAGEAK